jgi:two-component system cell cycle response regulator DivK
MYQPMQKKVLIMDDDSRNIFALRLVLQSRGYNCVATSDAAYGLDMMEQDEGIAVVLLDMMMPERDGYELLQCIRNSEKLKHLPVIAVTAQAMQGDREKCLAAGATDYVPKPVDIDKLTQIIERHVSTGK